MSILLIWLHLFLWKISWKDVWNSLVSLIHLMLAIFKVWTWSSIEWCNFYLPKLTREVINFYFNLLSKETCRVWINFIWNDSTKRALEVLQTNSKCALDNWERHFHSLLIELNEASWILYQPLAFLRPLEAIDHLSCFSTHIHLNVWEL